MNRRALQFGAAVLLTGGSGCSRSPTLDVFGSYFPAWMLCLIAGIVLTFGVRSLLLWLRVGSYVGPPALIYPCLVAGTTCLLWLLLYR